MNKWSLPTSLKQPREVLPIREQEIKPLSNSVSSHCVLCLACFALFCSVSVRLQGAWPPSGTLK